MGNYPDLSMKNGKPVKSIPMVMTGGWITGMLRSRLTEKGQSDVLEVARGSKWGITDEQVLAVARGDAEITGDTKDGLSFKEIEKKTVSQCLDIQPGLKNAIDAAIKLVIGDDSQEADGNYQAANQRLQLLALDT